MSATFLRYVAMECVIQVHSSERHVSNENWVAIRRAVRRCHCCRRVPRCLRGWRLRGNAVGSFRCMRWVQEKQTSGSWAVFFYVMPRLWEIS